LTPESNAPSFAVTLWNVDRQIQCTVSPTLMETELGEKDMEPPGPTSTSKVAPCPTAGRKTIAATMAACVRIARFMILTFVARSPPLETAGNECLSSHHSKRDRKSNAAVTFATGGIGR
jgi:hypothetical protein